MGLLDTLMSKLQQDNSTQHLKNRLSDFLKHVYVENLHFIHNLQKEVEVNPYPHISKQINEVLEQEKQDNEIISTWLQNLNIDTQLLSKNIQDNGYHNLGSSIENRMKTYELLVELINLLDNANLKEEYSTLNQIKQNMLRHIDTMENLMTKFNG